MDSEFKTFTHALQRFSRISIFVKLIQGLPMNTAHLKNKLIQSIHTADERLLRIVNAVFESYSEGNTEEEEEIVAYSVDGEPLTVTRYRALNDQAEATYQNGHFSTHEEIKEKFKADPSY